VAKVGKITETPSSGDVSISINDEVTPVQVTTDGMTATDVNDALMAQMVDRGWTINLEGSYIVIERGTEGAHVTRVSFRSTDPAIVRSELRIEQPYPTPPVP
jgi:hypothetical protein